jgi:hypothetical protein
MSTENDPNNDSNQTGSDETSLTQDPDDLKDDQVPGTFQEDLLLKINALKDEFSQQLVSAEVTKALTLTNFLSHFRILQLLYNIKPTTEMLASQAYDRQMLTSLLQLYSDLLKDIDSRIENKVEELGDMLPDVLCRFLDSGQSSFLRFIFYYHPNKVSSNKYVWRAWIRILLVQCIFGAQTLGAIVCLTFNWLPKAESVKWFPFPNVELWMQGGLVVAIITGAIGFLYANAVDFVWYKWFGRVKNDIYEQQVLTEFENYRNLDANVTGIRDEIKLVLADLIKQTQNTPIKTQYGTYITLDEIKRVVITALSLEQRYILFILLGYQRVKSLLSDMSFVYWVVSDQFRKYGWVVVASVVSIYYSYSSMLLGLTFIPGINIITMADKWLKFGLSLLP